MIDEKKLFLVVYIIDIYTTYNMRGKGRVQRRTPFREGNQVLGDFLGRIVGMSPWSSLLEFCLPFSKEGRSLPLSK